MRYDTILLRAKIIFFVGSFMKEEVFFDNINILHGGRETNVKHSYGPIIFTRYVLQYIYRGKGEYYLNGKKYALNKGDMFMLPEGQLCFYRADENEPYEYFYVSFNGAAAKELLNRCGLKVDSPIIHYDSEVIEKIMRRIYELTHKTDFTSRIESLSAFYALLAEMLSKLPKNNEPFKTDAERYVARAKAFIGERFSLGVTTKDISSELSLNRSYLSTVFKAVSGVGLIDYIIQVKLSAAISLLEKTNMSVAEIAEAVGFSGQQNFYVRFKAKMGVSPSEYRKQKVAKQLKNF